jgi:hypothetical protein
MATLIVLMATLIAEKIATGQARWARIASFKK